MGNCRFERKLTHQPTPFFEATEESEREVKKHTQGHAARKKAVFAWESFCLNKNLYEDTAFSQRIHQQASKMGWKTRSTSCLLYYFKVPNENKVIMEY